MTPRIIEAASFRFSMYDEYVHMLLL